MLPFYSYKVNHSIKYKKDKSIIFNLKNIIILLVYYFYPRYVGNLINSLLTIKKLNNFKFVRADCDHFGSWVFLLLYLNKKKYSKDVFFCLAKKNTIDDSILKYFSEFNLKIIYNPFLHIILSPLFFTKNNSIDVNGHFPLSYLKNNKTYPDFINMGPIDNDFLKKVDYKEKNNNSQKKILKDKREFILFYPRFGDWSYSCNKSRRNMSFKVANTLLQIINRSFNIIMLGNTKKYFIHNFGNLYSFEELTKAGKLPQEIYSESKFIIGSISGATHFPSLLYDLPTLYFGDLPIDHILAIYNMVNSRTKRILEIPSKDRWILIDFELQDLIQLKFWESILNNFLFKNKLEKDINCNRYKLQKLPNSLKNEKLYKLQSSAKGNLYLHRSYSIKLK